METVKLTRKQIEETLVGSVGAAFSLRPSVRLERVSCGIASLDDMLHGGLPVGTLTEFVGKEGSGRTSVALAYISALTQIGNVCAWIDVADALDPESVAANGVDLERLLWVRCGSLATQQHAPAIMSQTSQKNCVPALATSQPRHTGGGSPHPRSEGRGMPQAISSMLHTHGGLYDKQVRREMKSIGTPGSPNRPLTYRSEDREEQVNSDRLPPRRGSNLAFASRDITSRCAEPQPRRVSNLPSDELMRLAEPASRDLPRGEMPPWKALDQALRATDLLLQGGGFSAIVLDLGSVQPGIAWRIPLATWFRYRAACERTRISLVLLTQHPCARSSAELVVRLQSGTMEVESRVMTGIRYRAAIERSRSHEREARVIPIRKPPRSERPGEWTSKTSWA